ncbi:DNA repair photolyase [Enterococcus sp. PF1-24]|uniref:SPL family radical SAM protein n=1 Tax=unclassified Enterococcus TaxID=2608891 RepID=UPI002473051E|nr:MULTISPECIES: radical SAM protein [unclassified Enterococcus]MDH6363593.1 DNA repair photolyase [Enterococcus sp. PFB1-1]MDH6400828.1 DNA repair photolyase [Enterococcus sp. PF1-24]
MKIEEITAKQILQKFNHGNMWFGIDYNMNLYRGCNHGCIYCDSRSSVYGIEDFDRVRVKQDANLLLNQELTTKRRKGIVGIGAMSDSYNPFEKRLKVTQRSLESLRDLGFGVALATKSDLVVRDKEILREISQRSGGIIKLSIISSDDEISRKIEPHVAVSSKRFAAIKELSQAGVFAGVLLTPTLPFITDTEKEVKNIVRMAYESQAKFVYSMYGMTLREGQREYFYEKLAALNPSLVKKYQAVYGDNYVCETPYRQEYEALLNAECQRYGLLTKMSDIIYAYKEKGSGQQLSLF